MLVKLIICLNVYLYQMFILSKVNVYIVFFIFVYVVTNRFVSVSARLTPLTIRNTNYS